MSETFIMPDLGRNSDLTAMAMMNGGWGNQWMNNPFMYLVFLGYMQNGGFGNNRQDGDLSRQIQTIQNLMLDNHNSDLIMAGILGNTEAVRQAADKMGLNYNALQTAVQGVANSVSLVGAQVGFSSERVINAINLGDANLAQQLCNQGCGILKSILEQGYLNLLANCQLTNSITNTVTNGFMNLGFLNQQLTCGLENTIRDVNNTNTQAILGKLGEMLTLALQDKIATLQAKNAEQAVTINNGVQSAMFNLAIANVVTPINAQLSSLSSELQEIQSKLPNTVTLPYSAATAVPTGLVNYYSGNYNNGYWS